MKKLSLFCVALLVMGGVASAGTLWSEDFQGMNSFTTGGDLPVGGDLIGNVGAAGWSLSGLNPNIALPQYNYAKVEDNTRGWPAPSALFDPLADGDHILEVRNMAEGAPDAWHMATYTLAAAPTQDLVTVSASLGTVLGGNNTSQFLIGDILLLELNGNGNMYLTVDGASQGYTGAAHDGLWTDLDFNYDFGAGTVEILKGGSSFGTWATGASASDVSSIGIRAYSWGFNESQGHLFADNLSVSEVPEPMTLSLLALGGLTLIRRRK